MKPFAFKMDFVYIMNVRDITWTGNIKCFH